jgi:eukaryotic-like serine/threonine-protein kinase
LGVLLFELLTGSRPYTLADLSPAAAEKMVFEHDIRKPSCVPGLLASRKKEIACDLDRIVLMAMDVDATRRYPSVRHLEQDLVNFLERRPVSARRSTVPYRCKKFAQRHKTAVVMACTTIFVLSGSILLYARKSRVADARLKQVQTLADSAITDMTEKLQQSSASVETQAALFHSTLNYLEQLKRNSGNDPRLLLELSKAYGRVGDLEGSPFVANLGNSETALRSYQESLRSAAEAHTLLPGDASTTALIEAYQQLARMEYSWVSLENLQKAADHYHQCLPLARDFWQRNPADPRRRGLLAANYSGLGLIEEVNREPDKALKDFRTALQILGSDLTGDEGHDLRLTTLYNVIGTQLDHLGLQAEALANLKKAVTIAETLARRSPPPREAKRRLYSAYDAMVGPSAGEPMLNVGGSSQAQAYAHKALAIAEDLAASDTKNADARSLLGYAYFAMGNAFRSTQPSAASTWYRKSIVLAKELNPPS